MRNLIYFIFGFLTVAALMIGCDKAFSAEIDCYVHVYTSRNTYYGTCGSNGQVGWKYNFDKTTELYTLDTSSQYTCTPGALLYKTGISAKRLSGTQWIQVDTVNITVGEYDWNFGGNITIEDSTPPADIEYCDNGVECTEGVTAGGKTTVPGLHPESLCLDGCEYTPNSIEEISIAHKNELDEWVTDYYWVESTGQECLAQPTGTNTGEDPPSESLGAPYPLIYNPDTDDLSGDTDKDGIPNSIDSDIDGDGTPNESDTDIDGDGIPNGPDTDVDGDAISNGGETGDWTYDNPTNDPSGASSDPDVDGDGNPNGTDMDVDGDGFPNSNDGDIDGDGISNGPDVDSDGDGDIDGVDSDSDGDGILDENDPDPDGSSVEDPTEYGEITHPELSDPVADRPQIDFQPLKDVAASISTKAPFNQIAHIQDGLNGLITTRSTPEFEIDLGFHQQTVSLSVMDVFASNVRSIIAFFFSVGTLWGIITMWRKI